MRARRFDTVTRIGVESLFRQGMSQHIPVSRIVFDY